MERKKLSAAGAVRGGLLLSLWLVCFPAWASPLDQALIATWTFPGGSLESAPPGFPFAAAGSGSAPSPASSWLRLSGGQFVFASDVNSSRYPDLRRDVTIWMRFRINSPAAAPVVFGLGLTSKTSPGGWKDMILGMMYTMKPGDDAAWCGPYAVPAGAPAGGVGPEAMIRVPVGKEHVAALVFNGETGTVFLYVDGVTATMSLKSSGRLSDFSCLALGRLKAEAPVDISFREVRVYSVALGPEWIDDLAADAREN